VSRPFVVDRHDRRSARAVSFWRTSSTAFAILTLCYGGVIEKDSTWVVVSFISLRPRPQYASRQHGADRSKSRELQEAAK
jgi:hypothetical protein